MGYLYSYNINDSFLCNEDIHEFTIVGIFYKASKNKIFIFTVRLLNFARKFLKHRIIYLFLEPFWNWGGIFICDKGTISVSFNFWELPSTVFWYSLLSTLSSSTFGLLTINLLNFGTASFDFPSWFLFSFSDSSLPF